MEEHFQCWSVLTVPASEGVIDSIQTFLLGYLVPILQRVIGLLLHLPDDLPPWPMELLICPELNLSHWQILFADSPSSFTATPPPNARNRDRGVFYFLPFSHSFTQVITKPVLINGSGKFLKSSPLSDLVQQCSVMVRLC